MSLKNNTILPSQPLNAKSLVMRADISICRSNQPSRVKPTLSCEVAFDIQSAVFYICD